VNKGIQFFSLLRIPKYLFAEVTSIQAAIGIIGQISEFPLDLLDQYSVSGHYSFRSAVCVINRRA
jgi:hypothetical protein